MHPAQRTTLTSLLLPICFILVGLGITLYNLRDIRDSRRSASWPQTNGTVTGAWIAEGETRGTNPYYQPVVTVSYNVGGRSYTTTTVSFGGPLFFRDRATAQAVIKKYAKGSVVPIHYDPANPRRANLEPGEYGSDLLPRMTFGILLLFFGTVLCWKYSNLSHYILQEPQRPVRKPPPKRQSRRQRRQEKAATQMRE